MVVAVWGHGGESLGFFQSKGSGIQRWLAASMLYSECSHRNPSEDLAKRPAFSVDFVGTSVCRTFSEIRPITEML